MTATTRCHANGRWTHEGTREDGSNWYSPTLGDTSKCKHCEAELFADVRYTGSAEIEDFGGVSFRDEVQKRDPLEMLARKIGAQLPFSVSHVLPAAYGGPWLVGSFKGGNTVQIRVASTSDVSWFAEETEDDAD